MKKWIVLFFFCWILIGCMKSSGEVEIVSFIGKNKSEIEEFGKKYGIKINIEEEYSLMKEGTILKQTLASGTTKKNKEILITISKGEKPDYKSLGVNELGDVPIMMYHGIQNMKNEDTNYIGGNIDKDGYQRTSEAFIKDLEFYYEKGYRMIHLSDFIKGNIDVEIGKSPIILTFDDGKNNIKVNKDSSGKLIIDPNSAVGILENFKKKYPDYNVTATFFLNSDLFESEYNEEIITWLIEHGYDIGNHSYSHSDLSKTSIEETSSEIGKMYSLLDNIISEKYVPVVALPFGSPYNKEHQNFQYILNSTYENKQYETIATLRVGWQANSSCFSSEFDRTFLKRIRAYDNEGTEFDIEMNFKNLEETRFISDGDKNTITIPSNLENMLNKTELKVISY